MATKQLDQQQKLTILDKTKEISFKEAARVAGVHISTVYRWRQRSRSRGPAERRVVRLKVLQTKNLLTT